MEKRHALLSVFHKEGIVEFAKNLIRLGFSILASGGTAKHLAEAGVEVTDVATLVGEAILGHRVVTLSRQIHTALLARKDVEADMQELARIGVPYINLVCVDLYPLEEEIAKEGSTPESVIEKTDIGGPTMIRSAIKGERIVICDPQDRDFVIKWLDAGEPDAFIFVRELRAKGEFIISQYCEASAKYWSGGKNIGIFGKQTAVCKYGENAWQTPAGLFSCGTDDHLALDKFIVVEGTAPSYNNFVDIERLLQAMTHAAAALDKNFGSVPFIAIGGKHGNPCGAAVGDNREDVASNMLKGDPLAIFGGLVMVNFAITPELAELFAGKLLDGIIAPGISPEAIEMLRRKKDKCRFIVNPELSFLNIRSLDQAPRFRYVRGGFLRQPNYTYVPGLAENGADEGIMILYPLSSETKRDISLAWAIGSTSNSNTITLVKDGKLIGNGVGQQDRVGAAELAIRRAQRSNHDLEGAAAYSDSFFPFPDAPKVLIDAGVKTIFTSSGSVNDQKTIDLCKERGVNLIMVPDALGRGFFGH